MAAPIYKTMAEYVSKREEYRAKILSKREIAHIQGEYVILNERSETERVTIDVANFIMMPRSEARNYVINRIEKKLVSKTPHGACIAVYIYCRYNSHVRRGF